LTPVISNLELSLKSDRVSINCPY